MYLRVPPREAQAFVVKKSERAYTSAKQDILEASLRHLELAAGGYDLLAREAPWVTIECFDAARGAMRAPKEIAQDVLGAVNPIISTQVFQNAGPGGR